MDPIPTIGWGSVPIKIEPFFDPEITQ